MLCRRIVLMPSKVDAVLQEALDILFAFVMERTVEGKYPVFYSYAAVEADHRLLAEKALQDVAHDRLQVDLQGNGHIEGIPARDDNGGIQQRMARMPAVDGYVNLGPAQLQRIGIGVI
jgi:hypothetical protein